MRKWGLKLRVTQVLYYRNKKKLLVGKEVIISAELGMGFGVPAEASSEAGCYVPSLEDRELPQDHNLGRH